MRNRLLFLALASLAILAFTAPSRAGSLSLVDTNFDFTANPSTSTVTDVTVTFSTTNISGPSLTVIAPAGSTLTTDGVSSVTETFPSALGSGVVHFTFETTDPFEIGLTGIVYSGGNAVTSDISVATSVIPEPSGISMLGIGVVGVFAFRKWFRRKAVA
jgi:hypothetical protein